MIVFHDIDPLRERLQAAREHGSCIALVPTMGGLHEGHASLVREAKKHSDIVIVSIYVNPVQFDQKTDFNSYSRDIRKDTGILESLGIDVLFCPNDNVMYPDGYSTYVEETSLSSGLCGAKRPGHFKGVATIVLKLFNITEPDFAIFGLKDYQQAKVIQKMIKDLNLPVRIITCPTVRENDGLAMSSRNEKLNSHERGLASNIFKALCEGREQALCGTASAEIEKNVSAFLLRHIPNCRIDYINVVGASALEPVLKPAKGDVIAAAVYIGSTRLIDNIII